MGFPARYNRDSWSLLWLDRPQVSPCSFQAAVFVVCIWPSTLLFPKYYRLENAPTPDNKYPGYIVNRNCFLTCYSGFHCCDEVPEAGVLRRRDLSSSNSGTSRAWHWYQSSSIKSLVWKDFWESKVAGSQRLRSGFYDTHCRESEL